MSDYNQTRSFNLGIAEETSIEAAMIYDDLAYAQKIFGVGYFFRSDEQMVKRFPMLSKNTLRRHVAKLVEMGFVSTKVKKVEGIPKLHYQIEQVLLPKMGKSMEIPKMGKSFNIETKKETKGDFVSGGKNNIPPALDLLTAIIEIVNPKEKPTTERLRMLNGRLKDYNNLEIINAAKAFSKSEWHKENKQMSVDNLLAPSKFGRWFDQGSETKLMSNAEKMADWKRRTDEQVNGVK